ncbi:alpha/beta fold hydrolase [Glaciibacter psychrotolerans]|uniref:Pimeloyl-ACP methyl ester carboxylesterase n=1 Tax=Glaciibacter psychrotolerans TaxID=670054 RepID=A0A7Z0J783_9MICO|nr:alpha/beta fold hydrolase [Leifsonia psychrotolerans]NYJ21230.1 pimeloyl-ACP methyl ester carboxylesterase [Leifsonia psychrotolerans]
MPHLDVPDASLYYETDGHISAPALLLIHAGVAHLRMWDPLIEALAANHFVIRYDTRGYGQTSASNAEFSNRADALAVLDHLGVARATVIGCSRGGSIAIDIAVENPERVAGLVTIGSGPSGFPDVALTDAEETGFRELGLLFEAQDWHRLCRAEVELWDFGPRRRQADLDPEFVRLAYELHRMNAAHRAERPAPTPLKPPAYGRVATLTVPALVTVGECDLSPALAEYEYLVTTIPGADGHVFPRTAHLPSVESPDEFLRVLMGWLLEADARLSRIV